MESVATYFCKCDMCKRDLYNMLEGIPSTHITVEFTVNNNEDITVDHKRYCDMLCLQEWVNKSMPIKN